MDGGGVTPSIPADPVSARNEHVSALRNAFIAFSRFRNHLAVLYVACSVAGAMCALGILQAMPDRYTASGLVAVQIATGARIDPAVRAAREALLADGLLGQVAGTFASTLPALRRQVSVTQSDGLALTVSATMRDPARAAGVVNGLIDDYVIAHALHSTAAATPVIRVLHQAARPSAPDKPGRWPAGLAGAVGGALVALLVQLAPGWARAVRTGGKQPWRQAGVDVISRLDTGLGRSLADALLQSGVGPQMAAMRATRATLGDAKTVSFVGGQPGPAASAAACAYARAAARDGQHVLLVDGDPAGAFMSRLLGEPGGRLGEVLRGEAEWRACVTHDRVAGLDTLVGMSDGAGGRRLSAVIDQAATVYDQIVLGAPEGTRLPRCDRAVMVLDGGETVVLAEQAGRAPLRGVTAD